MRYAIEAIEHVGGFASEQGEGGGSGIRLARQRYGNVNGGAEKRAGLNINARTYNGDVNFKAVPLTPPKYILTIIT